MQVITRDSAHSYLKHARNLGYRRVERKHCCDCGRRFKRKEPRHIGNRRSYCKSCFEKHQIGD